VRSEIGKASAYEGHQMACEKGKKSLFLKNAPADHVPAVIYTPTQLTASFPC
jgi:hypothetical protein